jgi:hypothetical protein
MITTRMVNTLASGCSVDFVVVTSLMLVHSDVVPSVLLYSERKLVIFLCTSVNIKNVVAELAETSKGTPENNKCFDGLLGGIVVNVYSYNFVTVYHMIWGQGSAM